MGWFRNLFKSEPSTAAQKLIDKLRKPKEPQTYDVGGIEPDLDQYALEVRADVIEEIMENGRTREEATALADSWYIMEVMAQYGQAESRKQYVPRPVWDWDWAWRAMFDTREEAVAHIEHKFGRKLDS